MSVHKIHVTDQKTPGKTLTLHFLWYESLIQAKIQLERAGFNVHCVADMHVYDGVNQAVKDVHAFFRGLTE